MGLTETAAAFRGHMCRDCFYCCYYDYADGHAWGDFRCVYICFEICVDHGHAWGDFRSDFYFTAYVDYGHAWGAFRSYVGYYYIYYESYGKGHFEFYGRRDLRIGIDMRTAETPAGAWAAGMTSFDVEILLSERPWEVAMMGHALLI